MDNVQDESGNSKPEEQGHEPVVKEKENVEEHGDCGKDVGCSEAEAKHEAQHASPTRKHVKHAKLVKLRRMKSKAKMVLSQQILQPVAAGSARSTQSMWFPRDLRHRGHPVLHPRAPRNACLERERQSPL
jgi:hypothetical protein